MAKPNQKSTPTARATAPFFLRPVGIKALMCEYAVMRTTLDIPDNVIKKSKIMAVQEGVALKKTVIWTLKK